MVSAVVGWDGPGTGVTRENVLGGGLDQDQKEILWGEVNVERGGSLDWDRHLNICNTKWHNYEIKAEIKIIMERFFKIRK